MIAVSSAAIVVSYLLGSIPTGLWAGLWLRGIDIREHGSKNIGATNTLRVLGKKLGAMALAGDMFKGVAAVWIGMMLQAHTFSELPLICGLAAIIGHTASAFLRFKGGKGVATGAGIFLALCPVPTLIAAAVFGLLLYFTRMVSVGSIGAAIALAGTVQVQAIGHFSPALRILVVIVAVLVIIKHRSNIERILQGKENKF